MDMDDVAPPIAEAIHHASLLSSFLLENSLCFGVNEIISFQKLVGNLDKMIVANLGRLHQRSLDSYFKSSLRIFVFVWSYKLLFHTIYIA
jgi:hypothetical protein